ncbi:MAG: archaeal proteasome endopeptidase complex subunit alpha [Nitrosopumilus sp.]|uniref:archaeal proteasome endopeptidase complex subunit alpha n=1 Tax=Nitrosopumilus sp. TaxID=2024843 RepID=UPI00246D21F3|nr:archaeal proteasome endopeptidase complex subunit alpha [Nitrosopumilus sp.]MDH5431578.1 archaeal proteasome endopeptidase complex subunit alpha [Nitrosopumilus sp.]MDH5697554.1 archaeal proteasome endopeptidase complex subunit alpha [Nitrosopumilus sp.]
MMASRGYDMTPTMYSPDGRIYQVEYAIETVKRGTLAIGIKSKGGVIMAVEEKPRTLQTSNVTQKIFQVDYHIGVAAAGYIPDARVQVDGARFFSQGNRMTYDESVEVATVAKHLADQAHQFTQYGGVRPNGVSMIIAGIDQKGESIYVTDPSGTYVQFAAVAIGANSDDVNAFLEKHYKDDLSLEDAASLAIAAINLKAETKEGVNHIKMAKITSEAKIFEKVSESDLQNYSQNASKFAP